MGFSYERPVSPLDGWWIKDDFLANESVADAAIGELDWEIVTIANASTYSLVAPTTDGEAGIVRIATNGTAQGDGSNLRLDEDDVVFGANGGGFSVKFRYPNIAGNLIATNNFRIGLNSSVTATAPTDGISLESLAGVLTLRSDSADHGDASSAITGVSTLTSGTTAVIGTWHTVRVEWSEANGQGGPGKVDCYVDGELGATVICVIDDDETAEPKITHWQTAVGGDTLELDLDFVEFFQWR